MEGNKDEARRCRQLGLSAWEEGDSAKAIRFLTKSMRMDPNPDVSALLDRIKSGESASRPSQAPGSESTRRSHTPSSHARTKQPDTTPQRSYTAQQETLCRQVLDAKSYYEMLSVKSDASEDAIKKAYRKLALQLHPDKNSAPKAEEAFKKISRAFQTLSDPQKRNRYDHTGQEDDRPQAAATQQDNGYMTAEELFQAFFGMGGATIYTGPDGRTFVQRRRMPRQNAPPQTEAQRRIYNLLQLLPVFIIVLFSILGSDFFSSHKADFRLVKTRDTPLLMETGRFSVPFFASTSFEGRYPPGSASRDRSEAEIEYGYFWAECRKAHETLRRDLEYYQAIGHRSKTNALSKELRQKESEHADCRNMRDIQRQYPAEANKVRTGHSSVLPGYRTW